MSRMKCRDCENEAKEQRTRCQECLNKLAAQAKARRKQFKEKGLCSKCGKRKVYGRFAVCRDCRQWYNEWHNENYSRRKEILNRISRESHARTKAKVLDAYGGQCSCCGETNPKFLTIDHVNNDGGQHRKEIGSGATAIYAWAEKNEFPNTLQLLCYNCNLGKSKNGGICPHRDETLK